MNNFKCKEIINSINLMELMEIESIDCLDNFRENISNGRENYEWDIIAIFKIYNNLIENPPRDIPSCNCSYCFMNRQIFPELYVEQLDIFKRYFFIMWFMQAITDRTIIDRVRNFIYYQPGAPKGGKIGKGGEEIRKRIDEFYKYIYDKQIELPEECCNMWKKKEYYYQQLFGIPYMLFSIGVPDQHYIYRDLTFFSDSIIGHPKASNGWYRESFEEVCNFGGIDLPKE